MQWNAEGVARKKLELQKFIHEQKIDIICIQETHLNKNCRFHIRGYETYRLDREGHKGGIITLVKNNIAASETSRSTGEAEHLTIKIHVLPEPIHVTNYYCPNNKKLDLENIYTAEKNQIILGDFNSHSPSWGYATMDARGDEVEEWMMENLLILINKPDSEPTFYSRVWRTQSTPDLAIATEDIQRCAEREVMRQLGGSDHKPIIITIGKLKSPENRKKIASWNYKKANWNLYRNLTEGKLAETNTSNDIKENITTITNIILKAAQKAIPRGRRKQYEPFWTNELQQLHEKATAARTKMEQDPSDENVTEHNKHQAIYRKEKLTCIRKSWHEKTATLNMEKDSTRLWHLVKSLNEEDTTSHACTVIEEGGKTYTGKIAANILADGFAKESNIHMPKSKIRENKKELKKINKKQADEQDIMNKPFSHEELDSAIKKLKKKKAPGPDGVTNEMIINLGTGGRQHLLDLINQSWMQGIFPKEWKEAEIIPIAKKGKPKENKESYRPISLLSCLGKTMERLVNNRLLNFLEEKNILDNCQSGFRKHRSTDDQITYLAQEIEDAFQNKHKLLATFFDLTKAFDKVWKKGLLLKLAQSGIKGHMFTWIRDFLHRRCARVKLEGHRSKLVKLEDGVPQGSAISPTLFILFINDLPKQFTSNIHKALHADDLAIWTQTEYIGTAKIRMQGAINAVKKWADTWGVTINQNKTVSTLFSLSTKPEQVDLYLDNKPLPKEDNPTYLGIKFDKRLTWGPHIEEIQRKATLRLRLMKKLAGTHWGADANTTRQIYTGYVRPKLEYGTGAYTTAAKTNLHKLDKIQNTGLRIITGGLRSTQIKDLEATAGLESLGQRREQKILTLSEKFKRSENNPMHKTIKEPTKNRIKRHSFQHLSKSLSAKNTDILSKDPATWEMIVPFSNTDLQPNFTVITTIPDVDKKGEETGPILRAKTLEHIDTSYPHPEWTHIYTDGSSDTTARKGGAGIIIILQDGTTLTNSSATGELSTNFRAEQQAIVDASKILQQRNIQNNKLVFLCDCLSVLQATQREPQDNMERELTLQLNKLSEHNKIILQWIPAHCGIPGNERADRLAKEGTKLIQHKHPVSLPEIKTHIKRKYKEVWRQQTHSKHPQDPISRLNRKQHTTIFRLRTGHCRLNHHMHRIKPAQTAQCACQTEMQTPEHILQSCPLYIHQREETWPHEESLQTKLWGTLEELQLTCSFIEATHLLV